MDCSAARCYRLLKKRRFSKFFFFGLSASSLRIFS